MRRVEAEIAKRSDAAKSFAVLPKRWIVERTLAWLARLRRLTVRCERRAGIRLALATLGCALVCLNQVRRFCWALLIRMSISLFAYVPAVQDPGILARHG